MPVLPNPRKRRSGITPNGPKIREAILHIIKQADEQKFRVTQFDILKTLFIADRAHLNRFGRPITFDDYVAMPDGPVPSLAYDVLKEAINALEEAGINERLWNVERAGEKEKKKYFSGAVRSASEDVLSDSDFEELNCALTQVHKMGYGKTWELVHKDAAYKAAWAKRQGDAQRVDMDYALLFDEPDDEQAKEVKFISEHV